MLQPAALAIPSPAYFSDTLLTEADHALGFHAPDFQAQAADDVERVQGGGFGLRAIREYRGRFPAGDRTGCDG